MSPKIIGERLGHRRRTITIRWHDRSDELLSRKQLDAWSIEFGRALRQIQAIETAEAKLSSPCNPKPKAVPSVVKQVTAPVKRRRVRAQSK